MSIVRGRLAPSPTGALHLGNARSFLLAWLSLRSRGGTVVLRIEDLDHPKVKPGSAGRILDDLRWLGLDWDEGPDAGGASGPYVQSERVPAYRRALDVLIDKNLVYPCVCSRRDVEEAQSAPHEEGGSPKYHGTCRGRFADYEAARPHAPDGTIPAWRFRVDRGATAFDDALCGHQEEVVSETVGDFVLARHTDGAGYMLAVVVDDHAMGITEVLRGDDLLAATHRQLHLYRALGYPPPRFMHAPLVVGEDGRRLAKRHGDTRLAALRESGIPPERVVGLLAWWSGLASWGEEVTARDLLPRYDPGKIPRRPAVLDGRVTEYLNAKRSFLVYPQMAQMNAD